MRSRKHLFYFSIGLLIVIVVAVNVIYLCWSPGHFELVSFDNAEAKLKWHGVNGTELRVYHVTVYNVGSLGSLTWNEDDLGSRTVNDGDVQTFSVVGSSVRYEIYYHHTEVIVAQDGFYEEFALFPNK